MTAEELIEAAQDYDLTHRPPMSAWGRVSDAQVLRLLIGAGLIGSGLVSGGTP